MHALRLTAVMVLGAVALATAAGTATAAATAVVSDKISVFQLPRDRVDEIVGLLRPGEEVTIDRCTASGLWCRVFSSEPTGWVPASYLIGAAAKAKATPQRSLTDQNFGLGGAFDDNNPNLRRGIFGR